MAETELGVAYKRNIEDDRRRIEFTIGVTEYDGFTVQETDTEATGEELVHRDSVGDTDQRVFYDKGKRVSVTATIKDTSGYLEEVPLGTIVALTNTGDSTQEKFVCVGSSNAQRAGENARITLDLMREDSMGATYDA